MSICCEVNDENLKDFFPFILYSAGLIVTLQKI